mmetsp:Transcript_154893/g.281656  ORF Transcript_154893/g.281656 Transcript_154893/m.281656 type:complete len:274 (+) Transcript_154893:251-1072(+)
MNGVYEDVYRSRSTAEEGLPLPAVVLSIEKHVCAGDADTDEHQAEQQEDCKHEAVHVIHLVVTPNGREDEVHLDKEASKRYKPSCSDHGWCEQPVLCWNGPLQVVHPAWERLFGSSAAAKQRACRMKRHAQHAEEDQHNQDRLEGHCHGGTVADCRRIDDAEAGKNNRWHEQALIDHCPFPLLPAKHAEDTTALVTTYKHRYKVSYDHRRRCGPTLCVVGVSNRKHEHDEDCACQVTTSCVAHCEYSQVIWAPEDITIHLLPATLISATIQAF